jgi:DedD protein
MEEKNELNDIILNRNSGNSGMKKIMLAVASLAILLIIVVVIMSSLNSDGTANLPQPIEPPKNVQAKAPIEEDPLFEPIAIDEAPVQEESLDNVAKKIKEQSQKEQESELITGPDETLMVEESEEVIVPAKYEKPVKKAPQITAPKTTPKPVAKKPATPAPAKAIQVGNYYVQVGSFGRFSPDKKFLAKITANGYTYTFHQVGKLNKVLIGPYSSEKAARKELKAIRANIEPGAFLSRI